MVDHDGIHDLDDIEAPRQIAEHTGSSGAGR